MEQQLAQKQADAQPRRHFAGSLWIQSSLGVRRMSKLGEDVADLLGDVFFGIYHLPIKSLQRVEWHSENYMEIVYRGELATFDGDELTRLVLLAHDRMIRVAVRGIGPGYICLTFSPRYGRTGAVWERHPTLEEHVDTLRQFYDSQFVTNV